MAAPHRQSAICSGPCGLLYLLTTLAKNNGMCGRCARPAQAPRLPVFPQLATFPQMRLTCIRCIGNFAEKDGLCKYCQEYRDLDESIRKLHTEFAELKQTHNNTITAYASYVTKIQKILEKAQ